MMKKLLLLGFAFILFSSGAKAQGTPTTSTPVYSFVDTLQYYLNKFYYKTNIPLSSPLFPYYKSAAATATRISHCGSRFDNPCGDTLYITGLQAYASRNLSCVSANVPVSLYLCRLGTNGLPILPPIDSIARTVSGDPSPKLITGNFKNGKIHKVVGDFAVLFRNTSTISGDTVRLMRTSSKTYTAWAPPPNTPTWQEKYSDSYGFVRDKGVFYSATNYTAAGFGYGTDYEFCVAPKVYYDLQASYVFPTNIPASPDGVCTFEQMVFKNTSSCRWSHRMYNLNEFYRKWNSNLAPFVAPAPTGGWPSDSALTWYFEMEDAQANERKFLPLGGGNNQIVFATDSAHKTYDGQDDTTWCFTDNEFRAHFTGMSVYGTGTRLDFPNPNYAMKFTICTKYCNGDALGLNSGALNKVKVFPNPVNNSKTAVTGLTGVNTITVHDMLGRLVSTDVSDKQTFLLDLSKHPAGNYLIRITDSSLQTKAVKVIKQPE